jgi:pyrimidine-nucleoside phosphorylase
MDEMTMRHAIERKREGNELDAATWLAVIEAYMDGSVDDAQMAALAMACLWRGLSTREAAALTKGMVESGQTIRYPANVAVVDKHSSGGVSDIVSLVVVPLVAACGVRVAKLSGRALGHTGGTIDKLETIPGMDLAPSTEAFVQQVQRIGCAIAAQTESFVPADKRLYRLRDRTATVPSIGLIASSIVSKKVAAGASAFVFDVKCGSASFMRTPHQAIELAKMLVAISREFGRKAHAVVSDMNEPLGRSIGTGIEVIEAREFLRGAVLDDRVREQCLHIATAMLKLGEVGDARGAAVAALDSGRAYTKFLEMVSAQGGSVEALEAMHLPEVVEEVRAQREGFVRAIDGVRLGRAAREWSANESIAGIRVAVRTGDRVAKGDLLAECFGGDARAERVSDAFDVGDTAPERRPLIYATV